MADNIKDYRCKLISKILAANSQDEVKRYIDAAMRGLLEHKINGHLTARFVDRTLKELEEFNPLDHEFQQWANIKMARIRLKQKRC